MVLSTRSAIDIPQYCSYCGKELVPYLREGHAHQIAFVYIRCPDKRDPYWKNFWREDKHSECLIDTHQMIYDFDPYTGEYIGWRSAR